MLAPSVAVMVTVWDGATEAAVAVNAIELVVAATITEAGTGSTVALLDINATVLPLAGAASVKVTVHVVEAPEVTLVGLQTSEDTEGLGVTVTVAVVLPPSVAVSVTVWDVTTAPAVAVNVVEVVAAGTVTEAGTGNAMLLFDPTVTTLPPLGAGWISAIVHVIAAPDVTLAGAHASEDTLGLGATVTVAVVLPPSVAVMVTV